MSSEPLDFSPPSSLEMPGEIVAMAKDDNGRLFATLKGGRVVDISDWFGGGTKQ